MTEFSHHRFEMDLGCIFGMNVPHIQQVGLHILFRQLTFSTVSVANFILCVLFEVFAGFRECFCLCHPFVCVMHNPMLCWLLYDFHCYLFILFLQRNPFTSNVVSSGPVSPSSSVVSGDDATIDWLFATFLQGG